MVQLTQTGKILVNILLIVLSVLCGSLLFFVPWLKRRKELSLKRFFAENRLRFFASLVLIAGFLTRVAFLDLLPGGLNQDEASAGYDAYAILKYGVDRNGMKYPVVGQRAERALFLSVYAVYAGIGRQRAFRAPADGDRGMRFPRAAVSAFESQIRRTHSFSRPGVFGDLSLAPHEVPLGAGIQFISRSRLLGLLSVDEGDRRRSQSRVFSVEFRVRAFGVQLRHLLLFSVFLRRRRACLSLPQKESARGRCADLSVYHRLYVPADHRLRLYQSHGRGIHPLSLLYHP